jgi:DNA-binding transcriptional LysR family regulator
MDIRHLDLNLLRVFDAVYAQRSVVAAVQVLGVPQPSVEEALSTLRLAMRDPLFIRTSSGLYPTALAKSVGRRVKSTLEALDLAIGGAGPFDPASSTREFSIYVSELFALPLIPRLVNAIREEAPGVQLALKSLTRHEVWPALADGRVELAIGHFPESIEPDRAQLFDDHHVLVVDDRHAISRPSMRRAALANFQFVRVGCAIEADDPLLLLALESNIRLTIPHAAMLPVAIAGSNLAAILPYQTARYLVARAPLRIIKIDPNLRSFPVSIQWTQRATGDAGCLWLRAALRKPIRSTLERGIRTLASDPPTSANH